MSALTDHLADLRRQPEVMRNIRPPMDAMCVCGTRYGEHRVNTLQCRNPKWSCGNGEPQWGESVFARAAS